LTAKHTAHLIILKHNAVLQFTYVELATLAIEKHRSSITKYSCMKLLDALNAISHPAAYSASSFSDEKKEALAPLITMFSLLMSAAFVDSWDKQLDCYATQATECAMAKHVKEVLDGTATQAAAAAMDAEPTADPALLKDIVKKQVDCHHKQLQQQFNQLKQMVARKLPANGNTNKPAKNTTRGATTTTPKSANRAPSTNKKQPATPLKSALRKPSPKTPASPKNATKKPPLQTASKEMLRHPEEQKSSSSRKHHQHEGEACRRMPQRKRNRQSKADVHSSFWILFFTPLHSQAQRIHPPRKLTSMVLFPMPFQHVRP